MASLIVTGANRGLGFEFAKQYAGEGWEVLATVRDAAGAGALRGLGERVEIHALDMRDFAAIRRFAAGLRGRPVDLLIANAGVYEPRESALARLDAESWGEVFRINSMAPLVLADALRPNLLAGAERKAIAMSSGLASIAGNETGGLYVYRSSKAALNAAWRSFARDNPELIATLASPGWVRTDMGGAAAPLSPEESIAGLRRMIAGLRPAQSGGFYDYEGREVPW